MFPRRTRHPPAAEGTDVEVVDADAPALVDAYERVAPEAPDLQPPPQVFDRAFLPHTITRLGYGLLAGSLLAALLMGVWLARYGQATAICERGRPNGFALAYPFALSATCVLFLVAISVLSAVATRYETGQSRVPDGMRWLVGLSIALLALLWVAPRAGLLLIGTGLLFALPPAILALVVGAWRITTTLRLVVTETTAYWLSRGVTLFSAGFIYGPIAYYLITYVEIGTNLSRAC